MNIHENERIDDLQINGLKLIQSHEKYCFTTDAVLLANFTKVKKGDVLADICSGSGIIPVLIKGKTSLISEVFTVEVDEYFADLISRNCSINNMQFNVICGKVQNCVKQLQDKKINLITANPPYGKLQDGYKSENHSIAKQEILLTLDELALSCSKILQKGGRLNMVHQASRLAEIFYVLGKYNLVAKRLQYVRAKRDKPPHLVLIEAVKDGGWHLNISPDLIIQNEDGSETDEIKNIYQRKEK